jgi:hypothetical protein
MNRIKSTYVCKNSMSEFPRYGTGGWTPIFIEGKEYDCEYEPWNFETGHRLNGAFRRYWVTGEDGEQREMNRTRFKAVFQTEHETKSHKRDLLLEGILGESPKKQRKEE